MFAVYKYVSNGDVVYVGKTDVDVLDRVNAHAGEGKFRKYNDCQIYFAELSNKAETIGMEALLINKYKPVLNKTLKYGTYSGIQFTEPSWKLYSEQPAAKKAFKPKDLLSRVYTEDDPSINDDCTELFVLLVKFAKTLIKNLAEHMYLTQLSNIKAPCNGEEYMFLKSVQESTESMLDDAWCVYMKHQKHIKNRKKGVTA